MDNNEKIQFQLQFNGYNKSEVEQYIAAQKKRAQEEINAYAESVSTLEKKLENMQEEKSTLEQELSDVKAELEKQQVKDSAAAQEHPEDSDPDSLMKSMLEEKKLLEQENTALKTELEKLKHEAVSIGEDVKDDDDSEDDTAACAEETKDRTDGNGLTPIEEEELAAFRRAAEMEERAARRSSNLEATLNELIDLIKQQCDRVILDSRETIEFLSSKLDELNQK